MAVKYLAGNRLWGTDAERLALSGSNTVPKNSWKILERQEITGSASTTIDVDFSGKKKENIMVLIAWSRDAGGEDPILQLGDDDADTSTSNYAQRYNVWNSSSSGSDTTKVTSDNCNWISKWSTGVGSSIMNFQVITFRNLATKEKIGVEHSCLAGATGSNNAPFNMTNYFKWTNTAQGGFIRYQGDSGGNTDTSFSVGSEIVVLGCDDTTTADSNDNAWEQIGQVSQTSQSEITTGVMSNPKKYMMGEIYCEGGNTNDNFIQFNNEAGGDYALSYSRNGTQAVDTDQALGLRIAQGTTTPQYCTFFILNIANKEKLIVGKTIRDQSGGDANIQWWVGKWDGAGGTNEEIDEISLVRADSTFTFGRIRVWGFD